MTHFEAVYASESVRKKCLDFLDGIPKDYRDKIYECITKLQEHPHPAGKLVKKLRGYIDIAGRTAEFRARVGPYRILYDIDEGRKKVIILSVRRRSEKTYG